MICVAFTYDSVNAGRKFSQLHRYASNHSNRKRQPLFRHNCCYPILTLLEYNDVICVAVELRLEGYFLSFFLAHHSIVASDSGRR